jgi:hypothetical protein
LLHIIITLDYEIFGNGEGDVRKHMVEPTEKILEICDRYNVPITIMFEVLEYLKFKEFDHELVERLGYSPATIIEEQLQDAVKRGHDVQLHIHPQWWEASYDGNRWHLPNPRKKIIEFSDTVINQIIKRGKNELINIVNDVNSNFSCIALRFSNMPWEEAPQNAFQSMAENNLFVHSLAVSTNSKNKPQGYWILHEENQIFEIPIFTIDMPFYSKFSMMRIKTALYRRKFGSDNDLKMGFPDEKSGGANSHFLKQLFRKYEAKWDLCKQSSKDMIRFIKYGLKEYDHEDFDVPLVMIAHSKDFMNEKNVERFFKTMDLNYLSTGVACYSTLQDFVINTMRGG